MLEDRKLEVLRAIVTDFVSSNEPVGSKALAERHGLGVSPATVRNDMAALEDEGYITHPHTSAGRIPTDKGYRLFVDRLSTVKPLSGAERRAIQSFLEGAVDLDDVVRRTVRLLAQLTQQVAVVQYPSLAAQRRAPPRDRPPGARPGCCSCSSPTPAGSSSACSSCPSCSPRTTSSQLRAVVRLAAARRPAGGRAGRAGRPARRRAARDPPGAHQRDVGGARDARRAARGARRARRHGQPDPLGARLPAHAAPGPRVARGAGGAAQAARRGQRPDDGHGARSARRTASRACGPPRW